MTELANASEPDELAQRGFGLYEQFRPVIPEGVQGWGAKGELDLGLIRKLGVQKGGGFSLIRRMARLTGGEVESIFTHDFGSKCRDPL